MSRNLNKYEPIVSSLELQISFYFHWRYSIIHILTFVIFQSHQLKQFEAICVCVWSLVEAIRIYFGYEGNLCEQVPHLFGFLFLSVFPQLIILSVIMVLQWNRDGLILIWFIMNLFQLLFICSELLFGYIAIRNVISAQTAKFKFKTKQKRLDALND